MSYKDLTKLPQSALNAYSAQLAKERRGKPELTDALRAEAAKGDVAYQDARTGEGGVSVPSDKVRAKPVQHEHCDQVAFFDLVRIWEDKYPVLKMVFAVPNRQSSPRSIAFFKAEGLRKAVPDILCCVARRSNTGLAIEMKHGKNKPDTDQVTTHRRWREYGWCVEVFYSPFIAWNYLCWYLELPDEVRVVVMGYKT